MAIFFLFSIMFYLNNGQEINKFEKIQSNGSFELTLSNQFKNAFSFYSIQTISLLKCASFCTKKMDCMILSFKKMDSFCELYSSQNLAQSDILLSKNSFIYRKVINQSIKRPCNNLWLPYKSICYRAFKEPKTWQEYVDFCASFNSTLLIADNYEKFKFFQNVSSVLTTISGNQRTWVYAKYDTINVFEWMNSNQLNTSFVSGVTTFTGCFGYYSFPNSLLDISTCSSSTSGICEYNNI